MDNKQTILVVEDELINRKILVKILAGNYDVIEAENGLEALNILKERQNEISGILLDIMMPIMNGYDFLDKLKEEGITEMPVIVMTGDSGLKSEQRALDAGAWDFVTKPYNGKVLLSRLRNAIARSQVRVYEQIRHMAEHDGLTGLHNRNRMYADTRKMIDKNPDRQFAFLKVDIDRFALFNSFFGETEGDRLLKYFAQIVAEHSRKYDMYNYGRMNADIFCMCIPFDGDIKKIEESVIQAEKELESFRDDYQLKLSVGLYVITDRSLSIEEMYLRASMGAGKCKNLFEKNLGVYDESLICRAANEIEITNEMQTALDEHQFIVYLQPKVELPKETICGAEALVRWKHPVKGLISPGEFIPIFEKNGFIAKVDYYVWESTCQMIRKWIDSGKTPYPVSVNISRISMYNPNLVNILSELVKKYDINPLYLELEITESAYMTDAKLMEDTIHNLRKCGFTILMDDFGSDYSSLNTLKSIEVDVLKIDMKFLPKGEDLEKGEIIIASVIKMANWLGMTVIVEGVETRRQRDFLEGVGCDCIQGYFYSRPIPEDEFEEKYIFVDQSNKDGGMIDSNESPKHNVTILVVDDDETDRALISEYFSGQYHVRQESSAEDGLVYLKKNKNRVRLILLDNVMKGMTGIDFLKFVQSEKDIQNIPIIMITANENTKDQVTAFQAGAYDYIAKPLVREVVLARVKHVMEVSSQIRAFENTQRDYKHKIEMDAATGLLNKIAFKNIATQILDENNEDHKVLMMVDIDDFKHINDVYGHLKGDEVLRRVAKLLRDSFRNMDIIGRFGGDEFLILISSVNDEDVVRRKADEIIKRISLMGVREQHLELSVSVGVSVSDSLKDSFDTLFARADQALYQAKSSGKSKAVIYGEIVPPVIDDDKPIVLLCGDDPQLYTSIALTYGNSVAFAQIRTFEELKSALDKYQNRISVFCIDIKKSNSKDSDDFYHYILDNGGGGNIPIIVVCEDGNMDQLRDALKIDAFDIISMPPQIDTVKRRLLNAIIYSENKKK